MELTKEQLMKLYKSSQSDSKKTQELYDSGYQVANFVPSRKAAIAFISGKAPVVKGNFISNTRLTAQHLANEAKHKKAADMLKSGKTPDEIWAETHLFKDREGRWMTELDNSSYKLNQIKQGKVDPTTGNFSGETKNLNEVIKGVDFIERGPLKNTKVRHLPDKVDDGTPMGADGISWSASHNTGMDGISSINMVTPPFLDKAMSNLRLSAQGKPFVDLSGLPGVKPTQKQLNSIFNTNYAEQGLAGPQVLHEVQHGLQKLFKMQGGSNTGAIEKQIRELIHPQWGVITQRENWLKAQMRVPKWEKSIRQPVWKKELEELEDLKLALGVGKGEMFIDGKSVSGLEQVARKIYKGTTGEVQAYEVEARARMTKEAKEKLVPFKNHEGALYRNKSDQNIKNYGMFGENSEDLVEDYLKKNGFTLPDVRKFK